MAECATDPPVLEVEYSLYGAAADSAAALSDGTLSEGWVPLIAVTATRWDPCITALGAGTDRADWTVAPGPSPCDESECTGVVQFLSCAQVGVGSVWATGLVDDQVAIVANPTQLVLGEADPALGLTSGDPVAYLRVGERWSSEVWASDCGTEAIDIEIVGDTPPGLEWVQLQTDLGQTGALSFDLAPHGSDVGTWEFDLVVTDEEGSTGAIPFHIEVVRACGCQAGARPSRLLGLLMPLAGLTRRRRR